MAIDRHDRQAGRLVQAVGRDATGLCKHRADPNPLLDRLSVGRLSATGWVEDPTIVSHTPELHDPVTIGHQGKDRVRAGHARVAGDF
jgi:hypothetical protein